MNKISQKMIEISEKLLSKGLNDRSEQFYILAEKIEDEIKISNMQKLSKIKIHKTNTPNIDKEKIKEIFNKQLTPYHKYKEL